ncbi:zinc finger HIT domain-containing protein 1 [Coccinella septempunctata]|uniref:zinc finger HIT domain-containing protein 1 n=1 Tax=Coccinella septempunctata TaxID=41139 RepID=UPI001D08194C|nr:zinc finger HIT domain-containing protein 1 [Coccinella septempunctata]
MSAQKQTRGSGRIKECEKRKIVDDSTRRRRFRRMLELLESDNYQEDPHADLVMSKKLPKFDDDLEQRSTRTKKRERTADYYQSKYRKTFEQMVEEDRIEAEKTGRVSYLDAEARSADFAARKFCNVCGFFSKYTCVTCGIKYCSIRCMHIHQETRCLKWTA